jgi:hypothetical protein
MTNPFALSYFMVSLTALGVVYFVLFARLRREVFRCKLRGVRDELFDYMWENAQDFDEPAYRQARDTINSYLALSNKLSPSVLVLATIATVLDWRRKGVQAASLPTGPVGDKIRQAYKGLAWTLIEYSFLKGIPGAIIWSAVWILLHVFRLHSRLRGFKDVVVKDGADYLQTVPVKPSNQTVPVKQRGPLEYA